MAQTIIRTDREARLTYGQFLAMETDNTTDQRLTGFRAGVLAVFEWLFGDADEVPADPWVAVTDHADPEDGESS